MKFNLYLQNKGKKELLGGFDTFENAEKFLFEHAKKLSLSKSGVKVEELAETHKKYHFDNCEDVFSIIKHIEVVAAIIIKDGKVFTTQRGYGEFKDGWEFPGGKMEVGETMQQALERELREELAIKVKASDLIKTIEYEYPKFQLTMHCLKTEILEGEPNLLEHEDAKWVNKAEIDNVAWLPADLEVIENIKNML